MSRVAWVLLLVGLLQMGADLLGWSAVKAIASAWQVSPAPKVFCAHGGLETFSTRFFLEWHDLQGQLQSLEFTCRTQQRLAGPYNRRNVFGAVIAYGPVLACNPQTRPMLDAVLRHAWRGSAPLFRELGIDPAMVAGRPWIRLQTRWPLPKGMSPRLEFPSP